MAMFFWLRKVGQLFCKTKISPNLQRLRRIHPTRIHLEQLEDRLVPSLTTLASFDGSNGVDPYGGLVEDKSGNLFGTTYSGGASNDGTVFEIAAGSGTINTLVMFNGSNGASPYASLIEDNSGNLYGTTVFGGVSGYGTVFKVAAGSGVFTTIASFDELTGIYPLGGVIEDSSGNLFGTTEKGGAANFGTVFEVGAGSNTVSTLASFYGSNGADPQAGVIEDSSGNLFGTAIGGGANGGGTVFKLAAANRLPHGSGLVTTLGSFSQYVTGEEPEDSLIEDRQGNLFGTDITGTVSDNGAVFEVAAGSDTITVIGTFNSYLTTGARPLAGLIEDNDGNLFGTTEQGGALNIGTVFELPAGDHGGNVTTVATFNGYPNGQYPSASLIEDSFGNLFGTTQQGGAFDDGTVFEYSPVSTTVEASDQTAGFATTDQPVTLSATVTSSDGSSVNSGIVTFSVFNGSTQIGASVTSGIVANGAASATYTLPGDTPVGTYDIHVSYSGGGSDGNSDNSADSTSPSLTINPNTVIVDNGQPGYSETGTWYTWSQPTGFYDGDMRYTYAGNGATASWQNTGLANGYYNVAASWNGDAVKHSTNVQYQIYDGSTLLQTVTADQTQDPVGTSYGGVDFQTLAMVHITSGTLTVVLSYGGNGLYVVADAVAVSPVPPSNTDLNWSATGDGISGPTSVSNQSTFTVNSTYTVSGAAAPGNFTIAYYASTSSSPSQNFSQAILLGTQIISGANLDVGNQSVTSPSFQLANGGTYYLFAELNADDNFQETDETNNLAEAPAALVVSGPTIVDNGGPGYSETGSWQTWSQSTGLYGGTMRYTPTGNGTATASWQATGLAVGTYYSVAAAWLGDAVKHSNNVQYLIYDGTTLVQTVTVDQTQNPVGTTYGGVEFQTLASIQVASGTLTVVMSNSGDGVYAVADAVAFTPLSPTGTDLNWAANGDGVTGPTSIASNTNFTIARTYTISGAAGPSSFTIAYFASTSSDPNQNFSQAILLGKETISAAADLALGNHTGTSPEFQLSNGATYYLFALLNADVSFLETNPTNNLAQAPNSLAVAGPYIIDYGSAGYSETGNWSSWTPTSGAYNGSFRYAYSGDGSSTVRWQATGLTAGATYNVATSWPGDPIVHSDNVVYKIYDGNVLLESVTVNQQVASSGATYGGVQFQTLATVTLVDSGPLTVVVSNIGDGTLVVADAVVITVA